MKLKAILLSVLVTSFGSQTLKAQDIEGGLFLGIAQYQGDLAPSRVVIGETQPTFGGLFRYYFNPRFNFKAAITYGWISGDDANSEEGTGRLQRNLSFRSHILEGSAQIEFNILPYINGSRRYKFAPYVFTGLSVFNFNPTTEFNGNTVDLQPLGTEGQNLTGGAGPYSLTQLSIPLGVGIKYSLGKGWNLGFEVGARKTFTDYLDDVSTEYADPNQLANENELAADVAYRADEFNDNENLTPRAGQKRGTSEFDDWYTFAGFTLTKTFRKFECAGF